MKTYMKLALATRINRRKAKIICELARDGRKEKVVDMMDPDLTLEIEHKLNKSYDLGDLGDRWYDAVKDAKHANQKGGLSATEWSTDATVDSLDNDPWDDYVSSLITNDSFTDSTSGTVHIVGFTPIKVRDGLDIKDFPLHIGSSNVTVKDGDYTLFNITDDILETLEDKLYVAKTLTRHKYKTLIGRGTLTIILKKGCKTLQKLKNARVLPDDEFINFIEEVLL